MRLNRFPLFGILFLVMLPKLSDAGAQMTYLLNVNFRCENGQTTQGQSVYVVGDRPEIGGWDTAKAFRLAPSAYPVWTGTVQFKGANPGDVVEWKCIIREENSPFTVLTWQPGANNKVTLAFTPPPTGIGKF